MASPAGDSFGSTSTLNDDVLAKMWSRCDELIGSGLPAASTLTVLSSTVHVAPPSIERNRPTPREPVSPSPVAAKMMVWRASLLRPTAATPPMLVPKLGPKSVSGMYVGPRGSVVRKLVVFQTPPEAPATNMVLP